MGCAYTAHGFELDYIGVIFCRDLVYDAGWRGNRKISHDSVVKKAPEEEFVNLVKQTYRVLVTRGMKGCHVYFEDAATREFLFSRLKAERASAVIGAWPIGCIAPWRSKAHGTPKPLTPELTPHFSWLQTARRVVLGVVSEWPTSM